MNAVRINGATVGAGHPCFVIAEIGINHNGRLAYALELIDAAAGAGASAVKFQKRHIETVYTKDELVAPRKFDPSFIEHALERQRVGGEGHEAIFSESALARLMVDRNNATNGDLKRALEFGLKEFDTIEQYCKKRGILWFASAWDGLSAHFMNGFDVPCHKIASACLTHTDLLRRVRSNGKPVILSTGGSTMEQVKRAVEILGKDELVLMHCVATYPSRDEDLNLSVINTLMDEFPDVPVGYSGHEVGIEPSLVAVTIGACAVERHITLDRNMPGSDQKASLEPAQFARLVRGIRGLESGQSSISHLVSQEIYDRVYGDGVKRVIDAETPVMQKLRRVADF